MRETLGRLDLIPGGRPLKARIHAATLATAARLMHRRAPYITGELRHRGYDPRATPLVNAAIIKSPLELLIVLPPALVARYHAVVLALDLIERLFATPVRISAHRKRILVAKARPDPSRA
jgi:hypothetical protein